MSRRRSGHPLLERPAQSTSAHADAAYFTNAPMKRLAAWIRYFPERRNVPLVPFQLHHLPADRGDPFGSFMPRAETTSASGICVVICAMTSRQGPPVYGFRGAFKAISDKLELNTRQPWLVFRGLVFKWLKKQGA